MAWANRHGLLLFGYPQAFRFSWLELTYIIARQEEKCSYCVPVFVEMIKGQGPTEMLKGELRK
jgi:hypothetical protein